MPQYNRLVCLLFLHFHGVVTVVRSLSGSWALQCLHLHHLHPLLHFITRITAEFKK